MEDAPKQAPKDKNVATPAQSSPAAPESTAPVIELPSPPEKPVQTSGDSEAQAKSAPQDTKPAVDRVIDLETPTEADEEKLPHLQAPRYVHHFDTFSLVRDLQRGGFSENQTVDIMKAIRGLLGENMDLARRALVSKSNVENVCCA